MTMDLQPRSKNGHPPHKTTGVLRTSCSHESSVAPSQRSTGTPSIGHMASNSTGTVRTRHDPKSAGHAPQFRIVLLHPWLDRFRLQFHAALWACSWAVLLDLRVHWAGVDDFPLSGDRSCRFQGHAALRTISRFVALDFRVHRTNVFGTIPMYLWCGLRMYVIVGVPLWLDLFRTSEELLGATFAAKVESLTVPFGAPSGRFIHGHAANGVNCHDEGNFQACGCGHPSDCSGRSRPKGRGDDAHSTSQAESGTQSVSDKRAA